MTSASKVVVPCCDISSGVIRKFNQCAQGGGSPFFDLRSIALRNEIIPPNAGIALRFQSEQRMPSVGDFDRDVLLGLIVSSCCQMR
jgi:hypothetical protein